MEYWFFLLLIIGSNPGSSPGISPNSINLIINKQKLENMSKAKDLLKKNTSVEVRAEEFVVSLKRDLLRDIIEPLEVKIEKINDKIFDLKDFSVITDLNKGRAAITREGAKARFTEIIELEYEKTLLERELEIKKASYDSYFSEEDVKEEQV